MSVFNQSRQTVIRLIVLSVFVVLIVRLFMLQIDVTAIQDCRQWTTLLTERSFILTGADFRPEW